MGMVRLNIYLFVPVIVIFTHKEKKPGTLKIAIPQCTRTQARLQVLPPHFFA